jgi:hypothetical protein
MVTGRVATAGKDSITFRFTRGLINGHEIIKIGQKPRLIFLDVLPYQTETLPYPAAGTSLTPDLQNQVQECVESKGK